ncbi:MAG: sulfate reduction electron transfer complex DsrMKJOP subunit DsrO [Candidatus Zixiibacteriota bacterium]
MSVDRRIFLKAAGLTTLTAAAGGKVFAGDDLAKSWLKTGGLKAERWAMVIDMKKCREEHGCTACIDACHLTHNVPKIDDPKQEIKWIWKESFEHAFHEQEHELTPDEVKHSPALVLCNHCNNPPCVRVCPTKATWKREQDGIVMMDWHRCIGCRYCIVACPYGSRSFNWTDPRTHLKEIQPDFPTRTKGVVEKCTFCEERLSKGQLPACVEACAKRFADRPEIAPALAFGDIGDPNSEVRKLLSSNYSIRRKPGLGTEPEVYYIV